VANNQAPYILLGIYESLYKDKYGHKPSLNKYREKWAMQDVIDSVGYERARELIEYYFQTSKEKHPLQFFYYNFDRIDQLKKEIDKDRLNRNNLLKATKDLVESENEH
jgi:hypothetical protein